MSNIKFIIPQNKKKFFEEKLKIVKEKCPKGCKASELSLSENILTIGNAKKMSVSQTKFLKNALIEACAYPITAYFIKEQLALLEKITRKKVKLSESNEANKNLAVEALNAISDTMDMLKNNIAQAIDQIRQLGNQDIIMQKLNGLNSIIDTSITDVSEAITDVTAIQTKEKVMNGQDNMSDDLDLHEDDGDDKGFKMTTDTAIKDIDQVSKIIDKGNNIILDDDLN